MPRKSRIMGWVVLLAAVTLGANACSDENAEPASETTRGAIARVPASEMSLEDWALEVDALIDEQNAGFAEVRSTYQPQLSNGPQDLDVEIEWLRADRSVLTRSFLPGHPDDDTLWPLYTGFLDSQESRVDALEAAADGLEAESEAIKADWNGGANSRHVELSDLAFNALDDARRACSELADAIVEVTPVSLNCVNQTGATPAESAQVAVGEVSLRVTGGPPLNLIQEAPEWVVVDSLDTHIVMHFTSDPVFADPNKALRNQGISGGIDWPDDMEAWLESVTARVLDSGETTVSGYPAAYWQFAAVNQGGGVTIIGLTTETAPDFGMQLAPGQVLTVYRIEAPGGPIMALEQGWDSDLSAAAPADDDSFPSPEDVRAWSESLFTFIELS